MKPLLVGEANPYDGDPYFALYPEPNGCAGQRLCKLIMQLDCAEYLRRFDRVNLCDGKWRVREARRHADDQMTNKRTFVLFGAKVASVFAWVLSRNDFKPFTYHVEHKRHPVCNTCMGEVLRTYVILPHPSGLSRAWNEPGAFERARAVLREAGVL